jgi:succinate dehydrogenase / fumarate reductase cytochrome b subunit
MNRLFSSSIGMKIVMAVSGGLLALFLVAHVLGNLEIFGGAEAINRYGAMLRIFPPLLWAMRIGLLTLVVLHIISAIRLSSLNRAARPARYAQSKTQATTFAARTMLLSGILLAAFIVYHILHFTVRTVVPEYREMTDALGRHDVYKMVTDAFGHPLVAFFYVFSMLLLGLHVSHGVSSMLQTLGVTHPRYHPAIRRLGPVFAVLIVIGFISVPLAVLAHRVP